MVGFDNLNDYYDVSLKQARLARLLPSTPATRYVQADLADRAAIEAAVRDASRRSAS